MAYVILPDSLTCHDVQGKLKAYIEDEAETAKTARLSFESAQLGLEMRGRISSHKLSCDACTLVYSNILADRDWIAKFIAAKAGILFGNIKKTIQENNVVKDAITAFLKGLSIQPVLTLAPTLAKVSVSEAVADALGAIGSERAIEPLIQALSVPSRKTRQIFLLDPLLNHIETLEGEIKDFPMVTTKGQFRLEIKLENCNKFDGQTALAVLTMQEAKRIIFTAQIQGGTARFNAQGMPPMKTNVTIPIEQISFFIKSAEPGKNGST